MKMHNRYFFHQPDAEPRLQLAADMPQSQNQHPNLRIVDKT